MTIKQAADRVGMGYENAKLVWLAYKKTGTFTLQTFRIRQKKGETREDAIKRRNLQPKIDMRLQTDTSIFAQESEKDVKFPNLSPQIAKKIKGTSANQIEISDLDLKLHSADEN